METQRWLNKDQWSKLNAEFSRRSLLPLTLVLFLFDLSLIGVSWQIRRYDTWASTVVSWVVLLFAFVHLYLIVHEAAHNAVSRRRWLNDTVGNLCGWIVGLPFYTRQRNHLQHHLWAAHPTGDPENAKLIEKLAVMTDAQARKLEFIWSHWLPMMAFNHIVATWSAPFTDPKVVALPRSGRERLAQKMYLLGIVVVLGGAFLLGRLGTFLSWYLPAWLGFLVAIELLNLPHHADAPLLKESDEPLPYWRQYIVSHNCAAVPVWSSAVILNFNLHVVHHAFPTVPWYRLAQLHSAAEAAMQKSSESSLNEFSWAAVHRRRPVLEVMGHFFERRPLPADTNPNPEPT